MRIPTKIIVEGFWDHGLTTLSTYISDEFGHRFIPEPLFSRNKDFAQNISDMFLIGHLENQKMFSEKPSEKIVMERSMLSSAAFFYATGDPARAEALLKSFCDFYAEHKPTIVFLYSDDSLVEKKIEHVANKRVARLLKDTNFVQRFKHFFLKILPEHGVDITTIKINQNEKIYPAEEIRKRVLSKINA